MALVAGVRCSFRGKDAGSADSRTAYSPKNYWMKRRPIVFGAVERGGRVRATIIPNSRAVTVQGKIRDYVLPALLVYTDDWRGYASLHRRGYEHRTINHTAPVYVQGDCHTQTIDGSSGC